MKESAEKHSDVALCPFGPESITFYFLINTVGGKNIMIVQFLHTIICSCNISAK